jgi:serine/threonine protein kinase
LHPGRGFTRSHLSAAILACITFSLFFLAFPARAFVFGRVVYPVLLLSTLLAFAQYREQEPGQADAASQETLAPPTIPPPGSEAATLTTLPGSGPVHFPVALCDRYTVLEPIGAGGMARVFRGVRKSDGRTVAVKIPKSNDLSTGTSFIKEISAWQHLSHQNIVEILDTNILPFPFIEMEYVPLSLEDIKKPVPVPGATRIVLGILEGLSYSHARGLVHRDLKPHNILLTRDGTPKISDWGLSTVTSGTHKMTLSGFSLLYAAPEQIAPEVFGPTGPWTDIYQVGIIFYELLTGRLPFGALEIETGPELLRRPPPEPPSRRNPAAAPIDPVVMKCLAASPRERYQTAEELLTALRDSQS